MVILIALVIVVILMVVAASKFNVHPFLSLLLAGIVMGFVGGLGKSEILTTLTDGFGKTLGSIGIIIAFGTIIGAYLEKSGGAMTLANWVIKVIGAKRSVLAMNLTGFIVCIPVYCDSGFHHPLFAQQSHQQKKQNPAGDPRGCPGRRFVRHPCIRSSNPGPPRSDRRP